MRARIPAYGAPVLSAQKKSDKTGKTVSKRYIFRSVRSPPGSKKHSYKHSKKAHIGPVIWKK